MNGAEIRWIVENLFVGNRLTRGEAFLDDGTPIDLTRIEVAGRRLRVARRQHHAAAAGAELDRRSLPLGDQSSQRMGTSSSTRCTTASAISASSCRRRSPRPSTRRSARW